MYNITFDDVTNVLETIDRSRVLQFKNPQYFKVTENSIKI